MKRLINKKFKKFRNPSTLKKTLSYKQYKSYFVYTKP